MQASRIVLSSLALLIAGAVQAQSAQPAQAAQAQAQTTGAAQPAQATGAVQAAQPAAAQVQAQAAVTPQPAQAAPAAPDPSLIIRDVKVGSGAEARAGMTVEVHYTGWLVDPRARNGRGRQFDSSIGRGLLKFPLGAGRVIKGWDQGVAGMRVGGKRTLIIPSALGYGARGAGQGVIPPNADLIFDVELFKAY